MSHIKSICIIDDDEIYQFLIKKQVAVQNLAEEVFVFPNGQEAIQYFRNSIATKGSLPDIVFLDVNMPVMDGWEFLDEYEKISDQLHKEVKLYMISSSLNESDINRAQKMDQVREYLVKPISGEKLVSLLQNA